jgi:hypothetical protein
VTGLLLAAPVLAQQRPDFSGAWMLNRGLSGSIESRIDEAAGKDDVKGTNAFGPQGHPGLGILPAPGLGKEVDRVMLRRAIVAAAATLHKVEITQSQDELKHVDAADNVRIFYLTREHARYARTDQKVKSHSEWRGETLTIEQKGDGVKLIEVLSKPAPDQLSHKLRLEHSRLKKPLELSLVYDRSR